MESSEISLMVAEVRRTRRNNIAITLAAVAVCLVSAFSRQAVGDPKQPGVEELLKRNHIQASKFELVDSKGQVRAALRLHDEQGNPFIAFYDEEGNPRGSMGLNRNGAPLISMQDDSKSQRLRMYVGPDREGRFELLDGAGSAQVEIAGGTPRIVLRDAASKASAALQTSENDASLTLDDSTNGTGIVARTGKKSGTSFAIFNKEGKRTLLPIDPK